MVHPIILFDGKCNLCTWSVQFIIKRDKHEIFLFSPQQSVAGKELMQQHNVPEADGETVVLIEEGRISYRSAAALRILKRLNGLWPLLYVFIIVPPFIRNFFYEIISRNRHKWFGRRETCFIPDKPLDNRFIV